MASKRALFEDGYQSDDAAGKKQKKNALDLSGQTVT